MGFSLKHYQIAALESFRDYLRHVSHDGADVGFYRMTGRPWRDAPMVTEGTPYVCIRIPTGGGKTIIAAHSIGIAAREYLQSETPFVLWLVPSSAILDQTLAALKNLNHPYRQALTEDFGHNISIMTRDDALSMSRGDATGGAVVIVSTIQAFRRDDTDGLKAFQDNGLLMDHFSALSDEQKARLDIVEGGDRPVASLANLMKLHRPMVIIDEAHNARTALSFDTLRGFAPSMILELSATPQMEHQPDKDKYASNILYSVSAAELKAEEMIKLPIRLTADSDWRKTIDAALDCQAMLEEAAIAEDAETGEYIRPIILFQAQSNSKKDPHRVTWEVIEDYLKNSKRIKSDHIAVHTGNRADLDDADIGAGDCNIRYVITVQKLKEGWDCPFAYILCSVAEQVSSTATEQILGRVLRMPRAKRKIRDALNRAYAFIASDSFQEAAGKLKDGLVEGAGFERIEAEQLITQQGNIGFAEEKDDYQHQSDPVDEAVDLDAMQEQVKKLPPSVKARVTIDPVKREITWTGAMSRDSRNVLQLGMAKIPGADKAIDRLYMKSNHVQRAGDAVAMAEKSPFIVPLLGYMRQGELELFSRDHFLDLPWRLDECDVGKVVERFTVKDNSESGEVDITDKGKISIAFVRQAQGQLADIIKEPSWTLPRLVNWIDQGVQHKDVTKASAIIFIRRALQALMDKGQALDILARYRYDLRDTIRTTIAELREDRQKQSYGALFTADTENFATSSDLAIIFDEQSYAFNQPYRGGTKFNKHFTPIIGDMETSGEEHDCAAHIDRMDEVEYWIRNVDRKPQSFWLQLADGKFYPDFVVKLKDGRIMAVEYKGGHLYKASEEKRTIGEIWAEASKGQCLFCMPTERDFALINHVIAGKG